MTITNNTKYQFIQAGYIVTEPYFGGILGAGATIDDARGDAIIRLVGIFEEDEIFRALGSFIYTPATAAAIATFLACDVRANFLIDNGPDGWDRYEKLEAHGCKTVGHPLKFFEGCAQHYKKIVT
jgi:hypothetical protein